MNKNIFLLFLFFPFSTWSEESVVLLDRQAEAFWEARDYTAASHLYEQLLSRSLPNWQRSRVLYNLGTIRIAQHQPIEALQLFEQITPTTLSLPRFGQDLFLNQGIAYLQYAQTLAKTSSPLSLDEQALFVELGSEAFKKAQALDCEVQKTEQEKDSSFSCQSAPPIEQWKQKAQLLLHAIYQKKRQIWLESSSKQSFQQDDPLQKAYLNYQTLLLEESITIPEIQKLLEQFEQLKGDQNQEPLLKQVKTQLQSSIEMLQSNHTIQFRFFLLSGLGPLDMLLKSKSVDPATILKRALDQANRTRQLFLFAQLMSDDLAKKTQILSILKDQQQVILSDVEPFIPAVLEVQKNQFQQAASPAVACQQSPWEQVIPLFDRGLKAALYAAKQFTSEPSHFAEIAAIQKQTITDWEQALDLLQTPPKKPQASSSSETNPQNLTETFRLIQEMHLQDQAQPEQQMGELHTW